MMRPRGTGGFTLIELIATIVILSVLGTTGAFILQSMVETLTVATISGQAHAELSIALDRIVREFRHVGLDEAASSVAPDIDTVTATSIAFNGGMSLALSGSQVLFDDGTSGPAVLLEDVSAFSVEAYDESNAALAATLSGAACDPIRRLAVTVSIDRGGVTMSLGTRVYLRSTMTETLGGAS